MKPVAILRHIECEGPGYLGTVLRRRGVPIALIAIDRSDPIPTTPADYSGVVIMGGPMSVNDADAWIARETAFIRRAIAVGLPTLGHCLGGQFIAKALGSKVVKNPTREIGWLPVRQSAPGEVPAWVNDFATPQSVFHWHNETFQTPPGATALLCSDHCENQAFAFKRHALAFQCHIEMTAAMVQTWSRLYESELTPTGPSVQSRAQMLQDLDTRIGNLNRLADRIYQHWIDTLR